MNRHSGPLVASHRAPGRVRGPVVAALVLLGACGSGSVQPLPPSAPEHLLPAGALLAASARSPRRLEDELRASPHGRLLLELGRSLLAGSPEPILPLGRVAAVLEGETAIGLYATGPRDGDERTALLGSRTEEEPTTLVARIQEALVPAPGPATGAATRAGPRPLPGRHGEQGRFALRDAAGGELLAVAAPGTILLEHSTRGHRIDEMSGLSSGAGRSLGSSRIFTEAIAALGQPRPADVCLFLDLQQAVELAEESARAGPAGPGGRAMAALRTGLDPRALESFVVGLDVGASSLAVSWHLALTGRVGIAALFELEPRPLELPAIIPGPGAIASGIAVVRLNLLAVLDSIERAGGDLALGGSVARGALEAAGGALGIRIREDVLARLTDEFGLVMLPPREDEDERPLEATLGRFVLLAGVRDVPGLRASLDAAVRARGLHAAVRKVRKVEGGEIWQAELARVRFALAFGPRAVGLAVGDGVTFLEACLARAARPDVRPEDSFAGHAAKQASGGGEPVALGSADLASVLEVLGAAARAAGPGGDADRFAVAARRLRELGIARVSGRTEQTASGICGRFDW